MNLGLSACYLGSLTCPLKLSRQVAEVEASSDYSPITHLSHHCDPPSQPRGRGTRGYTSQGTQMWREMPTASSQQDWAAQIRDASSTQV